MELKWIIRQIGAENADLFERFEAARFLKKLYGLDSRQSIRRFGRVP